MLRRTTRPVFYLLMMTALSISRWAALHGIVNPMLKLNLYVLSILISVALLIESILLFKKTGKRNPVPVVIDTIGLVSIVTIVLVRLMGR